MDRSNLPIPSSTHAKKTAEYTFENILCVEKYLNLSPSSYTRSQLESFSSCIKSKIENEYANFLLALRFVLTLQCEDIVRWDPERAFFPQTKLQLGIYLCSKGLVEKIKEKK